MTVKDIKTRYRDITIQQGVDFWLDEAVILPNGLPFNFTGYFGRGQIRRSQVDVTVIASFIITFGPPPSAGVVHATLTATQTAALSFYVARYDIEVVAPDGSVARIFEGVAKLSPEVTR